MSGIFWEPESQPDLMEAVTGYTASTLNLAMAVPMFLVDLLCLAASSVLQVASYLLLPVLEFIIAGFFSLLEMTGLELGPLSTSQTLITCSVVYFSVLAFTMKSSCKQQVSMFTTFSTSLLWMISFLTLPDYEAALYPRAILLALAIQAASFTIKVLLAEYNQYKHGAPATPLDETISAFLKVMKMEAALAMIVAVYGFPVFSAENDVAKYFCLVPLVVINIVYFSSIRKEEPAEALVNGDVVKETEVVVVSTEEPASVVEEVVAAAEETAEEIKETVKEKVEQIEEAVKDKVEEIKADAAEVIKSDPLLQRLVAALCGFCSAVKSRIMALLAPIICLITRLISSITSLPWTCITLTLCTNSSHLLTAKAWLALTGNPLSHLLPIISLVLPAVITKFGSKLPTIVTEFSEEMLGFAAVGVQYLLIAGVGLEEVEE